MDYIYAKSGGKPTTVEKLTTTFKQNGKIESVREIIKFLQGFTDNDNLKSWINGRIAEESVDENLLFTNRISTDQKKQAALQQVLMLELMYGYTTSTVENPEFESVIVDSEDKIIARKKVNGDTILFGMVY